MVDITKGVCLACLGDPDRKAIQPVFVTLAIGKSDAGKIHLCKEHFRQLAAKVKQFSEQEGLVPKPDTADAVFKAEYPITIAGHKRFVPKKYMCKVNAVTHEVFDIDLMGDPVPKGVNCSVLLFGGAEHHVYTQEWIREGDGSYWLDIHKAFCNESDTTNG